MTPSRPLDERFADWVDGRLSAAELRALELELERDPELEAAAIRYRQTVESLRAAVRTGPAPQNFADAVLGALAPEPKGHWPRRWLPFLASASAAAALVLLYFVLQQVPPRGEVQQSARAEPAPERLELGRDERAHEGDRSGAAAENSKQREGEESRPAAPASREPGEKGGYVAVGPGAKPELQAGSDQRAAEGRKTEGKETEGKDQDSVRKIAALAEAPLREEEASRELAKLARPGAPGSGGGGGGKAAARDDKVAPPAAPRAGLPADAKPAERQALDEALALLLRPEPGRTAGVKTLDQAAVVSELGELVLVVQEAAAPEAAAGAQTRARTKSAPAPLAAEERAASRRAGIASQPGADAYAWVASLGFAANRLPVDLQELTGAPWVSFDRNARIDAPQLPPGRLFMVQGDRDQIRGFVGALSARVAQQGGTLTPRRLPLPVPAPMQQTKRPEALTFYLLLPQ